MRYCYVNIDRLVRFKRKRKEIVIKDIQALLLDPMFRAIIEFRKRTKAAYQKAHPEEFDDNLF